MDTSSIVYAIIEESLHSLKEEKLQIAIRSREGEFVLYEDASKMDPLKEVFQKIVSAEEIELAIDMGEGNFSALAYSRI